MQLQKYNTQAVTFLNSVRSLLHRWGFKCGFVQSAENIWCLNIPVSDGSGTHIQFLYSSTWNEFRLEYLNYGSNCQYTSMCSSGDLDEQIEILLSEDNVNESPFRLMALQEALR
jgi:hypothetical protein